MKAAIGLKYLFLVVFMLCILSGNAQRPAVEQIAWADSTLDRLRHDNLEDSRAKLNLLDTVFQIYQADTDTCNLILVRIVQSGFLDNIGMADSALACIYWAKDQSLAGCDSALYFSIVSRYTNVLISLGEIEGIDSISGPVLDRWKPSSGNIRDRFAILTNLAISQAMLGEIDASTSTFRQVYHEAIAADDTRYAIKALINLGSIKGMTEEYDSAYYFLNIAALTSQAEQNTAGLIPLLMNLANVDMERMNFDHADQLLDSAYSLAEKAVRVKLMADVLDNKASLYEIKKEFLPAYEFLRSYIEMREEFLNEERVRAVADMREKYQSELKARQIQQLELDKLDSEVENGRIRNARNGFIFLVFIVLIAAIGLGSRLRYMRRSRAEIQREKDVSDGLLLNILPAAVAEELKEKGHAEAKYFDTATIMFSDFEDFTKTASKMEAAALVEGINTYFEAFDEITTKYGVEKIKTIGDSYMAAGGIDDAHPTAANDVVCAAIEIQNFVRKQKVERESAGLTSFDMRVGVHSGPVVAGIVGIKKFQYDLWGDTVNIASRMENLGVAEKINISEATYYLIKDDPRFTFESRGVLEVKGKGEMQMYFVEFVE